jgi:peroxiredoxin
MAPPTSGPRTVKEFVAVDGMSLGSLPMGIGIPPGGPSYAAAVLDGKGERVEVGTILRERGNVLLVFSRGGFCPYSSFEIRELARNEAAFRARGISVLVITADRPPEADKTRATFDTPFPILSDSDLVLHDLYRVGHLAEAKELKSLALAGADIEAMSNRQHHRFAVPSLFLVGKKGLILWSHASEDERTRPKVSQILAALDARNLPPKEAPPSTAPSASSAPSAPH